MEHSFERGCMLLAALLVAWSVLAMSSSGVVGDAGMDPRSGARASPGLGTRAPPGLGTRAPPTWTRLVPDLDTASAPQLALLPGIGPKRAAAIVTWREKNGPLRKLETLRSVYGFGPATVERLADRVRCSGDLESIDRKPGP